jgi:hypothetical protein
MRRSRVSSIPFIALLTCSLVACGGDGGGVTSNDTKALSPQEAQAVAVSVFTEVDRALANAVPASFSRTAYARAPYSRPTFDRAALNQADRFTATINSACERGGRITGTLTFTDDTDRNGTGPLSGSMVITPEQCSVSTGSGLITVGGKVTYTFDVSLRNGEQVSDFIWHAKGTLTWHGPSCDIDYTIHITPQGHGSVTGTVCGESVNGTF